LYLKYIKFKSSATGVKKGIIITSNQDEKFEEITAISFFNWMKSDFFKKI
jgi:hypothetical protein